MTTCQACERQKATKIIFSPRYGFRLRCDACISSDDAVLPQRVIDDLIGNQKNNPPFIEKIEIERQKPTLKYKDYFK